MRNLILISVFLSVTSMAENEVPDDVATFNVKVKEIKKFILPDLTDEFVQGDASNLPFKDESLDLVVSLGGPLGISENKEDNIKMLQEIKTVFLFLISYFGSLKFFKG